VDKLIMELFENILLDICELEATPKGGQEVENGRNAQ